MIIVILVQLPFFCYRTVLQIVFVFFFLNRAKYPFSILFEINDLCMDKKKKIFKKIKLSKPGFSVYSSSRKYGIRDNDDEFKRV